MLPLECLFEKIMKLVSRLLFKLELKTIIELRRRRDWSLCHVHMEVNDVRRRLVGVLERDTQVLTPEKMFLLFQL